MGKLLDYFGKLTFANEAEVSQNFILPLLTKFLGYQLREIIPEKHYPAKDLYSGVNFAGGGSKGLKHRPDFVICIDADHNLAKFIIDSKGPTEDIDHHLGQLRSYANSVEQNFLMITNGIELKVFDVNSLIFHSNGFDDLQLKLPHLINLLSRLSQLALSSTEILQQFDLSASVTIDQSIRNNDLILKRRLMLVDFSAYLDSICNDFLVWHLPSTNFRAIENLDIKKVDPNFLLSFRLYNEDRNYSPKDQSLKFQQIESSYSVRKKVFVGETGTGKTSLLKFLTFHTAENSRRLLDTKIPVYVPLKEISINYSLETLILAELARRKYSCDNLGSLPANQFVFFLDAFDEIKEQFRGEVIQAIEHLSVYHDCYISTRPNAVPKLSGSVVFELLPLNDAQVETVSRQYVGSRYYDFQRQVESNGLVEESRNTLLLLFLISLFHETGTMPNSASKIIYAMVDRVKKWQDNKNAVARGISWDTLSSFLSTLAFAIMQSGQASLGHIEAEQLFLDNIIALEERRRIPLGTTIDNVIEALSDTGLVIANSDHIYFWHRLFLNHFAAIALAEEHRSGKGSIETLVNQEKWDIVIIAMASSLKDITILVSLLKERLWLAAYCLTENPNCSESVRRETIQELIVKTQSPISDVRKQAIGFLESIDDKVAADFFFNIFEDEDQYHDDVIMMALPVIAKTGSVEARAIIYQKLNWDEQEFFLWRSSQSYISHALSHFGSTGILQIIENWKKFGSMPLDETNKRILMRLATTGMLDNRAVLNLQKLYLDGLNETGYYRDRLTAIAEILGEFPDEIFADQVLQLAITSKLEFTKLESVTTILASCVSIPFVEKIKQAIFMDHLDNYAQEAFAKALRKSVADLPKEFFDEIISHKNISVAINGLMAMERFPFQEVVQTVNPHLHGDQPQLQSWALQLMIDNGRVIDLIRQQDFPNPFFTPTAHNLLIAVRRYHLTEAIPLLLRVKDALSIDQRYLYESHLAYELAGTLHYLGENGTHGEVIAWYFDGKRFLHHTDYLQINLMKKLKFFEPALAAKIAECFYNEYLPSDKDHSHETEVFIETAEDLGTKATKEKVKLLTDHYITLIKTGNGAAQHSIERPLRALTKIAGKEDEQWLLDRLGVLEFDSGFEFNQLRRAVECLAHIGSKASLPQIRAIAGRYRLYESLVNVCRFAVNSICRREQLPVDSGDILL